VIQKMPAALLRAFFCEPLNQSGKARVRIKLCVNFSAYCRATLAVARFVRKCGCDLEPAPTWLKPGRIDFSEMEGNKLLE